MYANVTAELATKVGLNLLHNSAHKLGCTATKLVSRGQTLFAQGVID